MSFGRTVLLFFAGFVLAATSYAQSLGDLARQQRAQQQQQQQSQTQPAKVLTNDDLPHSGSSDDLSVVGADAKPKERQRYDHYQGNGSKLPPEAWKQQIGAMKQNIASMQTQIEQTKASVHFVEAPIYRNGVQHNMRQEEKLQQVDRMQAQLEEMKHQLEQAQEEARKQGYGSSVYDP